MSMDFDRAVAHALSLPDTVMATSYGQPAVKVASNGRAFLSTGREAETSFVIALDPETIAMLKETDPATFWQSPHYEGYPAVLVRYDSPDPDRVRATIERARDRAAAMAPVRPRKKTA